MREVLNIVHNNEGYCVISYISKEILAICKTLQTARVVGNAICLARNADNLWS